MMRRLLAVLIPTILLGVGPGVTSGQQPGPPADTAGAAADTAAAALPGQVDVTPDSTAPPPPPPAPKPVVTPASGVGIKLEGMVQPQGSSSTVDSVPDWEGELRRMRLTLDGDAGKGFSGRLMFDFDSQRARVRDAYADWKVSNALTLRGGQFKPPFNILETTSAKRLLVIERGNRIRGATRTRTTSTLLADAHYSARNRGAMAIVKLPARVTLSGGGWLGSGEANEDNDGLEFGGRLEWSALTLPSKYSKPLVLGVAVSTNGFFGSPRDTLKVISGDSLTVDDAIYGTAVEGSVEYGAYGVRGLHLAGNVVAGDNPFVLADKGGDVELQNFLGYQGWGEYLLETTTGVLTGVGVAFRADHLDPDTDADDDGNWFLTPGLNVYFGTNWKIMANYEILNPDAEDLDTEGAFRLQTQLLF